LLPALAGVYLFKNKKGEVIYVGKSANLKNRVRSYFQKGAKFYNAAKVKMLASITSVEIIETDSEIEALVKETELIKKIKPRFNVLMRDSKNYLFVGITKEDYPRVLITHQPKNNLKPKTHNLQPSKYIGPFTDAKALRKTLRLLRPIFPYYTKRQAPTRLEVQLGLVPNDGASKADYKKSILSIKNILPPVF